ncbi:Replication factor A protein 2 [Ceratocystis lukuohia]|uniref:Replication factor A protein 2 n=3 Tax=Ceratocystis TaxID=5157 RepID=A0A0F8AWE7_CERFI|nr:Replication factor A protein 2 [Ceratocystis platani]PHH55156.1 Replication protein A 32 kDa subunit B [Ceratocystis fimbriata CBS 114723]
MSGYGYGDDGGGFVQGGSQYQGSQGGGSGEKSYARDSLRPVTIKQILECEESQMGPNPDFRIDGESVTQLTFVAQIRQYTRQNTAELFRLDDGTSMIDAKKFLSSTETNGDEPSAAEWEIDSWVRAYGRVKVFGGKRSINIHVVRPVESYNEVNYHMLEAAMVHLYYTRQAQGGGGGGGGGDGMFVDGGGDAQMSNYGDANSKIMHASAPAKKIWKVISTAPRSNEGMRVEVMATNAGLDIDTSMGAAQELMSIGLLYNTVDENTFDIMDY